MSDRDIYRIVILAMAFDALIFWHRGQWGTQPVLMPGRIYQWH